MVSKSSLNKQKNSFSHIPVNPPRIALGEFSEIYSGVTIDAEPTPRPAMNLPT